jgi:DNA-binding NarL/FixJ family response regulator
MKVCERMRDNIGEPRPTPPLGVSPLDHAIHRMNQLTDREHQVAALLATGITNQAISSRLGVSEATVKAHVGRILLKLDLESRTAAAVAAVAYLHPCRCRDPFPASAEAACSRGSKTIRPNT